ncbi:MAG: hypothetical protein V3U76_15190 [Granulosicoccus sp.]
MSGLTVTARPGLRYGMRPERKPAKFRWMDRMDARGLELIKLLRGKRLSYERFHETVREPLVCRIAEYNKLSDVELVATGRAYRAGCAGAAGKRTDAIENRLMEALALAAAQSSRTLGLMPHVEQLYAAWAIRHGYAVDMQTGEGKSLVAALAAIVVALEGTPVHVVTVNEYLVARDASKFQLLYRVFGLQVAALSAEQTDEERRAAYAGEVVYVTGKQLAFDYLRDRITCSSPVGALTESFRSMLPGVTSKPLLRGLCFAIVDEIDSVLIDEARTPLILAVPAIDDDVARDKTENIVALGIAKMLHEGIDFVLNRDNRSVELTDTGMETLHRLAERFSGVWKIERYRSERIRQALTVMHLLRRECDYIVRDRCVELIDESTGRTMPDRQLQQGLQRMLEVHARVEITPENEISTAISFQDFFSRYQAIAGMSGSLLSIKSELLRDYGLQVVSVPTHQKCIRVRLAPRVFDSQAIQLRELVRKAAEHQQRGQPLLVGTRSVQQSELVSALLHAHGVDHRVLNAMQDEDEAGKVASAGRSGAVTVATNMAGRGSDIALDESAAQAGGLSVIALSVNNSRRIDRQLFGRSARQGDPGCCQQWLALDDELVIENLPPWYLRIIRQWLHFLPDKQALPGRVTRSLAQLRVERRHARQRFSVLINNPRLERHLAIGGKR